MTEKLVRGEEFQNGIQNGINKLADAVKDTLGPLGNTVVIKNAFGEIVITKDGVSVAEEIFLEDPVENIGSELVKEVALKVNSLAGDGTTSATVLAQEIYNAGIKQIRLGAKPLAFNKGIKSASIDILNHLRSIKKEVNIDSPELRQVALVSSNGDEAIADTITDIYRELGVNAVVSVIQGDGIETTKNIVKGMQFDRGYISSYCITDKVKMKCDFENPLIFLYDGKISDFKVLFPALEYAGSKARPLVIVAENVQDSALRALVINHASGNVQSAVVMSPGYGKKRLERLEDMAILFGGEVFNEDSDMEQFDPSALGEVDTVEITNADTAFIGGRGDNDLLEERINHIKALLKEKEGNKYETGILEERLGKISSGVAVVKVGAISKEEGKELLDRVEDCKNAVRAALSEGIVEGGGMALFNASEKISKREFKSDAPLDIIEGYKCLLEAVQAPFNQILINAGEDPKIIVLLFDIGQEKGYDVKKGKFVTDMLSAGIIDPFKVVRIALESAVSIVGTLLTSNYAVINKQDTTVTNFR